MFSFNVEIWELVLYSIKRILPAAVKAIAVFYSADEKTIIAKTISNEINNSVVQLDISKCFNQINDLRTSKQDIWLKHNEIPFDTDFGTEKYFNIFTENERNVLSLSFPNPADKKNDILFVYLPESRFLSGISSSLKILSQENKNIIGQLVKNSVNHIIDTAASDNKSYEELIDSVDRLKTLLKKKEAEAEKNSSWIEYAQYILDNYEFENFKTDFVFSDDAINLINNYNGKIYNFAEYIKKAAKSALILNNPKKHGKIIIETYNFSIIEDDESEAHPLNKHFKNLEPQLHKAYLLLDRYEEAAAKAIKNRPYEEKHRPLTGTEIGNYVDNGITPAAISDAIRKKRSKISKLLLKQELFDKWPLLRKQFKPIINTLTPKEIFKEKIA